MRALIVDDEPLARSRLRRMLAAIGGVQVIAEAADGHEALVRIREDQPDVVFLDIRMPGMYGISVATEIDDRPLTVFTTAYDEHAIEAFDAAAVDYLLKPIQRERLETAVKRLAARLQESAPPTPLAETLRRVLRDDPDAHACRIQATEGHDIHLFDARELTRLFASAKYVVVRRGEREFLIEESLSDLEVRLAPYGFFRTHRAELVNLRSVQTLTQHDGVTQLVLRDGQVANVSRRLLPELKRALGLS